MSNLMTPDGLDSWIEARIPSLNQSEQRVARDFVAFPDEIAQLPIAAVAARTGSSPSTVTRTCQNLGFDGFSQVKLLLRGAVSRGARPTTPSSGSSEWLPWFFQAVGEDVGGALGAIDYAHFDAVVRLLPTANRVLIVANGGSAVVAQNAALTFLIAGVRCEAPPDAVHQQIAARTLGPDDVCFVISSTGSNRITLEVAKAAVSAGATVVALTAYAESPLVAMSRHVLVIGATPTRWADQATLGPVVQLVLVQALRTALEESGRGESRADVAAQVDRILVGGAWSLRSS